jgi:hypothetical protein
MTLTARISAVVCAWAAPAAWLAVHTTASAASGLAAPGADDIWPQWQARVALQAMPLRAGTTPTASAASAWLGTSSAALRAGESGAAARGLQGGALLGDYYFARPLFGNFRASGGVLVGGAAGLGSMPAGLINPSAAAPSVGVSLLGAQVAANPDNAITTPYLGLGFSGALWQNRVSFSADLGLVSERPRALLGNQGVDNALRDMRLSPVMQLGLRYSF